MRFFKYGFSVLQLYTRVTTLHSCYMKIALIFSQSDKRNFFFMYIIHKYMAHVNWLSLKR